MGALSEDEQIHGERLNRVNERLHDALAPVSYRHLDVYKRQRLSLVELAKSPSIFFAGMEGARIPVAVAHGEGYADFSQQGDAGRVLTAARYIDNRGNATEAYPFNPNGSPGGLCLLYTSGVEELDILEVRYPQ